MEIRRYDNSIIKKRKINLENLDIYDEEKIKLAIKYLNEEIENSFVSHFDYISYILNNKKDKFSSCNRNTGCVTACKNLKKRLNKLGLKTYFVSCKANVFSNKTGNSLIKEAHVFLIYPSLKNNKLYFTIFDPGFRSTNVISFYDKENSKEYPYLSGGIIKSVFIKNNFNYPYTLTANKRINYKHEVIDANINWEFNPYYETLNIDGFNEKLYHVMFSLKLMNYPKDINKYICIRSKILEKSIDIYTLSDIKTYSFKELSKLDKNEIRSFFKPYFIKSNLSINKLNKFIESIFLLIHDSDTYIKQIIDPKVIEEYEKGSNLF